MESRTPFIATTSLVLLLSGMPADASEPAENAGNTESEKIAIDPALEKILRESNPALSKPYRPIKKIVFETKAKLNAGTETTTLYDCSYVYADFGVVVRTCDKRWSANKELTTSEITFMGLSPSLASASGYRSKLTMATVTQSFITSWYVPFKMQNQTKMTRWDVELSTISHPKAEFSWNDSYAFSQDISTSSLMAFQTRHTHHGKRRCLAGRFTPASSSHERLLGDSLRVECDVSGSQLVTQQWVFLVESGLYVMQHIKAPAFEITSNIVEIEYY